MTQFSSTPPDWVLPEGVNKTQWEYISNEFIARNYDSSLKDNELFTQDISFLEKHFKSNGIVLDLGCGTGRVAKFFTTKRIKVLGVDLSLPMLFEAVRKKTSTPHLYIRSNMVDLSFLSTSSIDYATCLFSSYGMLLDEKYRRTMLRETFRILKPGGKFVLHAHNLWSAGVGFQGYYWFAYDLLRRSFHSANFGNRKLPNHQGITGLTLHLFTWSEIQKLLVESNFQIIEVLPLGNVLWTPSSSVSILKVIKSHGFLIAAQKLT